MAAALLTEHAVQRLSGAVRTPHPQGARMSTPTFPYLADIGNYGYQNLWSAVR
ncbi:hypothetical protein [Streptomyces sp. NPDC091027]|uniref:hypothetical protein n=1 Tax=Streptomyces sp. NPDC091027 TaxID=3365971 RepID=UPI003819526B